MDFIKIIKSGKQNKNIVVIVIIVLIIIFLWPQSRGFPGVNGDTYQAVFLTNNQVYFGELRDYSKEYVVLENIFYLQVSGPLQQANTSDDSPDRSSINLVKLGDELHGPEDRMFIPKEQILFWENLKGDSSVVQAILRRES